MPGHLSAAAGKWSQPLGKAPAPQFPTAPPGPAHSFTRPAGSGMTLPSVSLLTAQVLGSGVARAMLAEGGLGDQQSLCRPRGQGAGEALTLMNSLALQPFSSLLPQDNTWGQVSESGRASVSLTVKWPKFAPLTTCSVPGFAPGLDDIVQSYEGLD